MVLRYPNFGKHPGGRFQASFCSQCHKQRASISHGSPNMGLEDDGRGPSNMLIGRIEFGVLGFALNGYLVSF